MLDSGATHNAREIKKDEDYQGLFPIEVEVAFDSEVKTELFVSRKGTIFGPERTETIVSAHEAAKAGYKVDWTKGELVVSKVDLILPIEIRSGTTVLPNDICPALIEEIEEAKMTQVRSVKLAEDEFQIKNIWPQLTRKRSVGC